MTNTPLLSAANLMNLTVNVTCLHCWRHTKQRHLCRSGLEEGVLMEVDGMHQLLEASAKSFWYAVAAVMGVGFWTWVVAAIAHGIIKKWWDDLFSTDVSRSP